MPSNHTYFQMSDLLHTDKQKMALMRRERGRHFLLTVSVVCIQLEHQKWTAVYSNTGRFNPAVLTLKRMDAKW